VGKKYAQQTSTAWSGTRYHPLCKLMPHEQAKYFTALTVNVLIQVVGLGMLVL
jgi:hypothetical protein